MQAERRGTPASSTFEHAADQHVAGVANGVDIDLDGAEKAVDQHRLPTVPPSAKGRPSVRRGELVGIVNDATPGRHVARPDDGEGLATMRAPSRSYGRAVVGC